MFLYSSTTNENKFEDTGFVFKAKQLVTQSRLGHRNHCAAQPICVPSIKKKINNSRKEPSLENRTCGIAAIILVFRLPPELLLFL